MNDQEQENKEMFPIESSAAVIDHNHDWQDNWAELKNGKSAGNNQLSSAKALIQTQLLHTRDKLNRTLKVFFAWVGVDTLQLPRVGEKKRASPNYTISTDYNGLLLFSLSYSLGVRGEL